MGRCDEGRPVRSLALLLSGIGLLLGSAGLAQDPPPAPVAERAENAPDPPAEERDAGENMSGEEGTGDESKDEDESKEEEETDEDESEEEEETEPPPCRCLSDALFADGCGGNWLRDTAGWDLYGFGALGSQWNAQNPNNNINGPVTMLDRSNTAQLDQLYLILERPMKIDADYWQLGGRVDLLYGTNYFFTMAAGLELNDDFSQRWNGESTMNRANGLQGQWYGLAMPQLYAEAAGHNWSIKAGHFYTIIGYEVVPATGNFFNTLAYTFQYGEPFTHTGVLANYKVSDQFTVSNAIVQGWDNFDNTNPGVSYMGGVTWKDSNDIVSLTATYISGQEPVFTNSVPAGTPNPAPPPTKFFANRTLYSLIGVVKLTEKLTYVIQHDHGFQFSAFGANSVTAQWYGLNQYLFYQWTDNVRAGLRGEWFRDDDGYRLGHGPGDYQQISLGLNWNPNGNRCLLIRPECRWDWANTPAYGGFVPGTRDFTDRSQFLVSGNLIYQF